MDERLRRFLREREEDLLEDILRLAAVPSVSTDRPAARRALAVFLETARGYGLETSTGAGGDVGIAEYGPGLPEDAETLGILAHVDVVDPGDPAAWTRNPWGELADSAVWGRGTQDDKGPLAMCLHAVRGIAESGLRVRRKVRFVVGTMEEIDWADLRAWLAEPGCRIPDYGFTPDGEFPVICAENGYCDAWLSFPRQASGRDGPFTLESLEAGTSINSVPDSARAVLSGPGVRAAARLALEASAPPIREAVSLPPGPEDRVELSARGRAAHSSTPERGVNALARLCAALSGIGSWGPADFILRALDGGRPAGVLAALAGGTDYGEDLPGPTVVSPDMAASDEKAFTLGINLRTAWGLGLGDLESAFSAAARSYGFTFRLESFLPAVYVPADRPHMKSLLRAYRTVTGHPGGFIRVPGSSYAKALPNHVAFGPILPGMPDLCHQADERMTLKEIRTCTEIYAEAIGSLLLE